jgi:ABC-type transport system substrate-binding protein
LCTVQTKIEQGGKMKRSFVSVAAGGLIASLLLGAGIGAIRTASAVAPATVWNAEEDQRVEGSWYISVQVTEPSPATFDALYGFANGGVFTRIDGRNNAPALGSWQRTEDGTIVFSNILFNFVNGVRTGYITGKFAARVVDGTLTGTFTAEGHGIPGFLPRSGTFTGTRIVAEAP